MLAATFTTLIGVRVLLALVVDTGYDLDTRAMHMQLLARQQPAQVLDIRPPGDAGPGDIMQRIQQRGTLRVGFDPDNLPFSFFNDEGDLVGFDVQVALDLAEALGLLAEFVPTAWPEVPELLSAGVIDIMPGMWYRPNWFGKLHFSTPYLQGTVGFAVRDERRHEFASVEELRSSHGLVIGIPLDRRQLQFSLRRYFDSTDVDIEVIEFWKPFFEGAHPGVDAFMMPVEQASAYSLLHPQYTAVVPQPDPVRLSTAFGVAEEAAELAETIDEWIVLAKDTGTLNRAYDHWILGQGAVDTTPRWSVARDLLGWEWGR